MIIKPFILNYKSSASNGVKSEGKFKSSLSINFELYEEEDVIVMKAGSKVDIKSDETQKWMPGVITQVLDTTNGRFLKLVIDGGNFL